MHETTRAYRDDLEGIDADDAQIVEKLNQPLDVILERTAQDYGHAVRAVRAKAHGILAGELLLDEGLPRELAQGLFAHAGTHPVYLRLSTHAGDILPDAISLPRDMAIKVLDVDGERLPGAQGTAQDFIMVNGTLFQAKTASKFLGGLKLLAHTTDRMEGTRKALSTTLRGLRHVLEAVGVESSAVNALGGAPNLEPLGETCYAVTPFRYGEYVAKFSVKPIAAAMIALTGKQIDIDGRENAIREEVRREMRGMDTAWEVRVQLCRDLDKQPVEDPTVAWDEHEAPFQRMGILRARPGQLGSATRGAGERADALQRMDGAGGAPPTGLHQSRAPCLLSPRRRRPRARDRLSVSGACVSHRLSQSE